MDGCFFNLLHVFRNELCVCFIKSFHHILFLLPLLPLITLFESLQGNITRAAEIHLAVTKHPFFLLLHFACLRASALSFRMYLNLAGLLRFHSDSDSCMAVWLIVLFGIFQGHCTHNDGSLLVMLPSWQVSKRNMAAPCCLTTVIDHFSK